MISFMIVLSVVLFYANVCSLTRPGTAKSHIFAGVALVTLLSAIAMNLVRLGGTP